MLRLIGGEQAMLNRLRRAQDAPPEEKKIAYDAESAIKESRRQISRAKGILEAEIRRIDSVLEGKP